jgi:outer membrane immunogenic protein
MFCGGRRIVEMKKLLVATSFAILGSVSAHAADLAAGPHYTKATPYVDPTFNWNGFYVGANAGYTWSARDTTDLFPNDSGPGGAFGAFAAGQIPRAIGLNRAGFIGGGQMGYNWQYTNLLVGLEADIQGTGVSKTASVTTNIVSEFDTAVSSKLEWLGTVRGRIGLLPQSNWLIYVTGGLAYGEVKQAGSIFIPANGVLFSGDLSEVKTGWTVGGGVEWAFARSWSAKAEYLYYDLGRTTITISRAADLSSTAGASFDNSGHIVRAGVNYHF